jgi:MFS family permease
VLLTINLFNYIDRYVLAAVTPYLKDQFFEPGDPLANTKIGWLQTAFLVSYMTLAPVFGALADRFSRWWIIGGGVALWSLASGWSGMATGFAALLLTRILVGVGEAAYGPAAPTIISDSYPVERRGRMLAYFYVAIPVGSAIGYGFGGLVAEAFGKPDGWRWPFYLVVLPGFALAVMCLRRTDPRAAAASLETSKQKPAMKWTEVKALFGIRSYVLNTAAMAAMTFAIGGMGAWLPEYLYRDRASDFGGNPSLGEITVVFGAITALAGLTATLLGGWCGDKLRQRFRSSYFLVSGIGMLLAFPFTIAMLKSPFPGAWILVFLAEFFLWFNTGPANTALANVTSPHVRSTAFALNILIIHALGDAISPTLIGWIADQTNMSFAFIFVSAMMVLASAFWLIGVKYLPRDTEAVERMAVTE